MIQNPSNLHRNGLACALLVLAVLAVFWPILGHGFVNYDDDAYLTDNATVQAGLTAKGLVWAFTTTDVANWHPLTWLSHMLDCQLFGLDPWGHHLTSLLLHIANTLLLFAFLRRTGGAIGKSLFVAMLFAIHPLHVESVAWAAERKDVLSTVFWMLALLAYAAYARRPTAVRYVAVAVCLALGLMAKPMLVTLPAVLVLLDYWPLERIADGSRSPARRFAALLIEKAPLFALCAASSIVTIVAQRHGGALRSFEQFSLWVRAKNALAAYVVYMAKAVWPSHLAVHYPHPQDALPAWQAMAAAGLLAGLSLIVLRLRRRCPYLATGWLWYLATLVPVLGIVQVGIQAMADRYTYVPFIGLFLCVAWGMPDLLGNTVTRKRLLAFSAVAFTLAMAATARVQVRHWQNSETLFNHALRVTSGNSVAHYNLGCALLARGHTEQAREHFAEALRIDPDNVAAHANLAMALSEQGETQEAIEAFRAVLRKAPDHVNALMNLGVTLLKQGQAQQALVHLSRALALDQSNPDIHYNVGAVYKELGRFEDAVAAFSGALRLNPTHPKALEQLPRALRALADQRLAQGRPQEATGPLSEALRLEPTNVNALVNIGIALAALNRLEEAEVHFARAVETEPDNPDARFNLANVLLRQGKLEQAVRRFSEYLNINADDADARYALGLALHELGRQDEAIPQFEEAIRLKPDHAEARQYLERVRRNVMSDGNP